MIIRPGARTRAELQLAGRAFLGLDKGFFPLSD
jgi:hypothetical protein